MKKPSCAWLLLVVLLAALLDARGNPLEHWTQRLPTELGPLGSRIIYANGLYVSVGAGGGIRISSDVTNWLAVSTPTTANLAAVTYGNGLFAAVGSGGTVLISSNGVNWRLRDLGTNVLLQSIVFGNGKFVAGGLYFAAVSEDGQTWTPAATPLGWIIDAAFGNGVFVVTTYNDGTYKSDDGLSWSQGSGFSSYAFTQIAFGHGVFVLAGSSTFYASSDGANWNRIPSALNTGSSTICFGNGIFVGSSGQFVSGDGTNWFATGTFGGGSLSYANGQFLASSGQLRISRDALTWRAVQYPAASLPAIAYADGAFVALGSVSARSTNGRDWTIGSTTTRDVPGIAYGNGMHVAVDSSDVHISTDGLNWTVPAPGGPRPYGGVAFGAGWFVIYDQLDGFIKRSSDGTNWIAAVAPPYDMNGIAFGNGRFAAAERDGIILVSSDAIDWSTNHLGMPDSLLGISFANGLFFAGTRSTADALVWTSYTSTDAVHWTSHPTGPDGAPSGNRIIFCNGMFVSPRDIDYGGAMLVSTDGVDWSAVRSQYSSSLVGLATDGHTAVGITRWEVFQSEPFLSTAPTILIHPKDNAVETGAAALLGVSAYGSLPLVYQWLRDGAILKGETNAQLLLRDVQSAGGYSVVVSNEFGLVTSEPAVVTVLPPPSPAPVITTQPQGRALTVGQTAYFVVVADGAPTLHYQWRKNGEPIAGATNASFLFRILSESDAGGYTVVVSNDQGTVTSEVAMLSVSQPAYPLILSHPQSQTVTNGGTASFEVEAAGVGPLRYQWRMYSSAIPWATNRTLTLTNVQPLQAGEYSVVVSNAVTWVGSLPATLTVYSAPSQISPVERPKSLNVAVGVSIFLRVGTSSSIVPRPQVQWFKDGQAIPWATNSPLIIPSAQMSDAGVYSATLSNLVGSVSSDPATVTVFPIGPLDKWSRIGQLNPSNDFINNVTWAGDTFFAVGLRRMATSSNGVDWSEVDFEGPITKSFYDVAHGGGQFVAVGAGAGIAFTYAGFPGRWAHTVAPVEGYLNAVAYGNGQFVAVGDREIVTSSNGEDWTVRTNHSWLYLEWVAFGNGRFVAVGNYGIITSTDGIVWTECVLPTTAIQPFHGVSYGNGRYVAVGSNNILNSDDGVTWRRVSLEAPVDVSKVAFGDGVFVALGNTIHSSIDGATWVRRNTWTNNPPGGYLGFPHLLVFGAGRFLHFSDRNSVFAADPVLRLEARHADRPELLIWSLTGRSCRIESAPSLDADAIWSSVDDVNLEAYPTTWMVPPPATGNRRFYRGVLLPVP